MAGEKSDKSNKPKGNGKKRVKLPVAVRAVMRVKDLVPAAYNPRTITRESKAGLFESIRRFGLVQPIVWNRTTRTVVSGHQRLDALISMGEQEAEVSVVQLSAEDEKLLNLTLNNRFIAGKFTESLADLLSQIQEADPDSFTELNLDTLQSEIDAEIALDTGGMPDLSSAFYNEDKENPAKTKEVTCPKCHHIFEV